MQRTTLVLSVLMKIGWVLSRLRGQQLASDGNTKIASLLPKGEVIAMSICVTITVVKCCSVLPPTSSKIYHTGSPPSQWLTPPSSPTRFLLLESASVGQPRWGTQKWSCSEHRGPARKLLKFGISKHSQIDWPQLQILSDVSCTRRVYRGSQGNVQQKVLAKFASRLKTHPPKDRSYVQG